MEAPYDFDGDKTSQLCSWVPGPIEVSFDHRHMEPGRDAMVLGWGHAERWRKVIFDQDSGHVLVLFNVRFHQMTLPLQIKDSRDYNSEKLKFAPVLLLNKTICKAMYKNLPDMAIVIEKYMICSDEAGGIDDAGNQIDKLPPVLNGCERRIDPRTGRMGEVRITYNYNVIRITLKQKNRIHNLSYTCREISMKLTVSLLIEFLGFAIVANGQNNYFSKSK